MAHQRTSEYLTSVWRWFCAQIDTAYRVHGEALARLGGTRVADQYSREWVDRTYPLRKPPLELRTWPIALGSDQESLHRLPAWSLEAFLSFWESSSSFPCSVPS